MGTFQWPLRISGMDERETREIEATVDTGAAYTTLPAGLLRELGVEPMGTRRLLLADGRRVDMDYGQAWVAINGERVVTVVVFGEDDGPALPGEGHQGLHADWSADYDGRFHVCNSIWLLDEFTADPRLLRRALLENGYAELPITGADAAAVDLLPPIHGDPFDRMLVAQAQIEAMTLLTADEVVGRYPGPVELI